MHAVDGARWTVRGHASPGFGWGHVCERFAVGLAALGAEVAYTPTFRDPLNGLAWKLDADPGLAGLVRDPWPGAPVLHLGPPIDVTVPAGSVWLTMWEVDGVPPGFLARANACRALIVPTAWNADVFRRHGVTVPIHVCPLGIDPDLWPDTGPRPTPGTLVIGAAGRASHGGARKGLDDVIRAFVAAFPVPDEEDVRLEVKCWPDDVTSQSHLAQPGITYRRSAWPQSRLAEWYGEIDVLVSASRGEGWGLMPHQAMACGTPVALVPWSGVTAYWTPACGWLLPYSMGVSDYPAYAGGAWAEPDFDRLVELMRCLSAHRGTIPPKGVEAARRAREFTWDAAVGRLAEILNDYS